MFSLLFNLSLFPTDFQTLRFVPLNSTSFLFIKFPHPVLIQMVKRLPTMWETQVRSLGCEDPLEKEMPTHSSSIAWNIPWTEDPGRLQSMGSQSRTRLHFHFHTYTSTKSVPNKVNFDFFVAINTIDNFSPHFAWHLCNKELHHNTHNLISTTPHPLA